MTPKKPETQNKTKQIVKNVDELYEKYYNAYKNDYHTDNELNEAKKKEFDYRQFELGDKKKNVKTQNWLHCQNGWALKMILTKQ